MVNVDALQERSLGKSMRGRRIKTAVSLSLVSALGAAGVTAWLVSSSSGDRSAGRPGLPGAAALPSADRPTLVDPNSFTANPATYQGREVVMLLPQTLFAPITNVRTVNIPGTTGEKSEQYIEVGQLGTPPLRGSVPVLLPEGSDGKLTSEGEKAYNELTQGKDVVVVVGDDVSVPEATSLGRDIRFNGDPKGDALILQLVKPITITPTGPRVTVVSFFNSPVSRQKSGSE